MRNIVIEKLENFAINVLNEKQGEITEQQIRDAVIPFVPILPIQFAILEGIPVTDEEIDQVVANLEQRYDIQMDDGVMLQEDNYKPWYHQSISDKTSKYWDRYYRYLTDSIQLPETVINSMDNASNEIMEVLGDPSSDYFERKGLVIGAVQSGKTSNYTALINKAADSGYKIVILLTGTIEKLRQQTQGRIDEGFIGLDSKDFKQSNKSNFIGVGKIDKDIRVFSWTDTSKDFTEKNITGSLHSITDPSIFVVKKNKSVLEKLHDWITNNNNINSKSGKVDLPLLIIDDEADNASINTNNPDKNPTSINGAIRSLLNLFKKYNYVGFTATPFANIFIDPFIQNNTGELLSEDLFPKDFIYLLEQPSNYIGPYEMYREQGKYNYMIRYNNDMEDVLPLKHKNGTTPASIPKSLEDAVLLFLLSNAVRDLRGQENQHRSMLIHVSRFIFVQECVTILIEIFYKRVRDEVKNFALADTETLLLNRMKNLYYKEYKKPKTGNSPFPIKESWEQVKSKLYSSIQNIQIRTINSGTASEKLNYNDFEDGLRLIAVGGMSLARGLTLEGLTISYFYRNTKMYDTLMQMGRWFGYRDGYKDLCRLWTSEESAGWYAHIAEATEELRWEVKRMKAQRRRPIDFGLRVRSATDTPLIVTARNKSKATEQLKMTRSLNGQMIETAILPRNKKEIDANNQIIENWLFQNQDYLVTNINSLGRKKPTLKNVPKNKVLSLLKSLEYPYMNEFYGDGKFTEEIEKSNSKVFEHWDVVIATNDYPSAGGTIQFGGMSINPINRVFDFFGTNQYIRMSASKRRLGTTYYALSGLDKQTYDKIDNYVKDELTGKVSKKGNPLQPTENMYFNTGFDRNPLIVIYPVKLKIKDIGENSSNQEKENLKKMKSYVENLNSIITGISIGIPNINGVESTKYEYLINKVYQMELISGSSNESDWEEEYDDDNEALLDY